MKRRILSLKIGQWVDAGFYTTGEVIQVHPLDENLVTVRFGSEIQNLNQRYTPLKPSQKEEDRSLRSIFRRGQWITHNTFGKGTVLIVNDVTLVIRFDYGIKKIASKRLPYVYVTPLQMADMDIESPVERRRTFFDTHTEHKASLRTCLCCGYPTLKESSWELMDDLEPAPPCVICGWVYIGSSNPDRQEMETIFEGFNEEYPNRDYSLMEARRNYEAYKTMYRPADSERFLSGVAPARLQQCEVLIIFFDRLMAETEQIRIDELWCKIRDAWPSRLS